MNLFKEKEEHFTKIFLKEKVDHNFSIINTLNDDDYIDYHIWYDQNWERLHEEYLPNTIIIRGDNPNIIFHGGCLGCKSQRLYGIEKCKGCMYFRFNQSKPSLYIDGESADTFG